MRRIRKATIGIRPAEKMFRVASLGGIVADEIIAAKSTPPLSDDYFARVTRATSGNQVRLTNENLGHYVIIDVENIIFVHDLYDQDREFDAEEFFAAFRVVWNSANSILKIKQVRRVGFVAEYRFPQKDGPSKHLLSQLTKLKPHGHVDKCNITFESRKGTAMGGLPDPAKDDFFNHIRQIYDSTIDADHPEPGHFNANLDVQRYYAPPVTKDIPSEVDAIRKEFDRTIGPFFDELIALGLCDEGAK